MLSGCPQYLLDKHQKVQNSAARLVCKAKKSDHIQPILQSLHWQPVTHRIQYKISTICFNSHYGKSLQYLSYLIQPYTPTRKLRSASDTRTFVVPLVNTKLYGEGSFSYTVPSAWISLPRSICHSDSSSSFKTALKTHFFPNCFQPVSLFHSRVLSLWSVSGVCVCLYVCVCVRACVRACVRGCVSVAIAIVKRSVLPLCVEEGRC